MAEKKVGELTRKNIMELVKETLTSAGYDVLMVASGSYGIPAVEDGDETAVKIVFQIPKGERNGKGYDVYEDAEAYKFKCNEAEIKRQKKAEEKAKKLAKAKQEKGE